jgi:glycosyltransferase involved in cell wall biosynthesis
MRVTVVDPPAYTPPYDHALCAALAKQGLDVELATSRFRHGEVPAPEGYRRNECFYRWGAASRVAKAIQHPLDMWRLARLIRREKRDIVHFQWFPLPVLDLSLVSSFPRPRVLTAHDMAARADPLNSRRLNMKTLAEQLDAIVVHSGEGRRRLVDELEFPGNKVHVIPHGAFDHLRGQGGELPIDPAAGDLKGRQVVLFFGLLRPYKGLDRLVDAFASAPDNAVLLIVGRPLMPIEPLIERARELGVSERVRFVPRFVSDAEIPAYFRRADLIVLPYREGDQSGVLFTGLAFGSPMLVSSVGGFSELAEHGAVRVVSPDDVGQLGQALNELLMDDAARSALGEAAGRAASGPYSWRRAAELTTGLYRDLLGGGS